MRQALSILIVTFFSGVAWSNLRPYMDATFRLKKAEDLLSRMTLEEKALQLSQLMIGPSNQIML